MAVLTRKEILDLIRKKELEIKPFRKRNVGATSVDLTLSNEFRIFDGGERITLSEDLDIKDYTSFVKRKEILLEPWDFVVGITKERIKMPNNLIGFLTGRTRYARFGLVVHSTASLIQPGTNNRQVLEIYNVSPNILRIKAGMRICQVVFQRLESEASYRGKFKNQVEL